MGVMHRIETLADRRRGFKPKGAPPFYSAIPLREIIAETLKRGGTSRTVDKEYMRLLQELGNELTILTTMPLTDIGRAGSPRLAEAISRMRSRDVDITPGFDGKYGKMRIFSSA